MAELSLTRNISVALDTLSMKLRRIKRRKTFLGRGFTQSED